MKKRLLYFFCIIFAVNKKKEMKKHEVELLKFIAKVALGLVTAYWVLSTGTELNELLMTH